MLETDLFKHKNHLKYSVKKLMSIPKNHMTSVIVRNENNNSKKSLKSFSLKN
jgi:hypothetical protein